jgi:protein-L-isoaspartate(D-aspartate) O-methyltransferase
MEISSFKIEKRQLGTSYPVVLLPPGIKFANNSAFVTPSSLTGDTGGQHAVTREIRDVYIQKGVVGQAFFMDLKGKERVLEIGTGSGYQAAVLAVLADRVYTMERIRPLAMRARKVLDSLGLLNVNIKVDDGTCGWEEEAPFDAIIVTAGAPEIPEALVKQLAPGGRLVLPVGNQISQTLVKVLKGQDGALSVEQSIGCRFVKLIGKHGWEAE